MGPGLCSDLDLFLSRLPALGMKTRRPGRGEPGNGSPASSRREGPGGLRAFLRGLLASAEGRWEGSRVWWMAAPPGNGAALHPGAGRRSPAGREVCSDACSEACWDACSAWEAEDILHRAGEWSCLPASTGLRAGRSRWIWHAEVSAALPNKCDPVPACQK